MKTRILLAAFLLGVGLCFVPTLGHGETQEPALEYEAWTIDVWLLRAMVKYVMQNPADFLEIDLLYDELGMFRGEILPEHVDTEGKIIVVVTDNRGAFSGISEKDLLVDRFEKELRAIYSVIEYMVTDMNTDIVGVLYDKVGILLAYFYQGEYYL